MAKRPKKLLDQVRDAIRLKHYAYSTEQTYVDCIRMGPGVKHPPKVTQKWTHGTGKPVACSLCLVQEQATRPHAVTE